MVDKNNLRDTEPMIDKWLVLVGDPETGAWSLVSQTLDEAPARNFEQEMTEGGDPSPRIVIYSGDFVQF